MQKPYKIFHVFNPILLLPTSNFHEKTHSMYFLQMENTPF